MANIGVGQIEIEAGVIQLAALRDLGYTSLGRYDGIREECGNDPSTKAGVKAA